MLMLTLLSMIISSPVLAIHATIVVGFNKNYAPYQFVDENGNPSGLHIDIMDSVGKDANTLVEYIAYDSDRQCIEALEAGQIDIALGVTKNTGFDDSISLTNSLSSSNLCLIATNDAAKRSESGDQNTSNIVAIEDAQLSKVLPFYKSHNKSGIGNSTFLCLESHKRVIDYLVNHRVEYAICEKNSALYILDQYNLHL